MHDRVTDGPVNSPETVAVAAAPAVADVATAASSNEQPAIRYATDAEVDGAMEKIFQKHDRLFSELAK